MRYPAEGVGITSTHVENTMKENKRTIPVENHLYACREYSCFCNPTAGLLESPLRM